jgi:hypothetical protein
MDINNAIGQGFINEFNENLYRVESSYELEVSPLPSRIEVETRYNLTTLEADADIIKYYNPVTNSLLSTVTRPLLSGESSSSLNNARSNITLYSLEDLIE